VEVRIVRMRIVHVRNVPVRIVPVRIVTMTFPLSDTCKTGLKLVMQLSHVFIFCFKFVMKL